MTAQNLKKLSKNVYMHTTHAGLNLGCIVTDEGAVSIDLPLTPQETLEWRAQINAATGKPLRAVVYTSPLRVNGECVRALYNERFPTPTLIHENGFEQLFAVLEAAHPHPPEIGLPLLVREQAGLPDMTFSDKMSFVFGSHTAPSYIDVSHVGGCAPGGAYVTLRDSGIWFVGDHVAVDEPPMFSAGDLDAWVKALTHLPKMKGAKTIVPGRGAPGNLNIGAGTLEFVKELRVASRKISRAHHTRDEAAKLAPELAAKFVPKRAKHHDAVMASYSARIQAGLEQLFDHAHRSPEAVIV
jgi:glyoxylase-like metal-dependent hydrolase (beta-lactamase superfamily II)